MSEMVTRVAKAMAEAAGFAWENCAQSQWERDARAGIKAMPEPWQPIETAPKDGTRILAFRKGWAEDRGIVFWNRDWREWHSVPGGYHWHAIAWQPLPAPPVEQAKTEVEG